MLGCISGQPLLGLGGDPVLTHSTEYYAQEILQCRQLEHSHWKPLRWNAYLHHKIKVRNAGMKVLTSHTTITQLNSQSYLPDSQNSS